MMRSWSDSSTVTGGAGACPSVNAVHGRTPGTDTLTPVENTGRAGDNSFRYGATSPSRPSSTTRADTSV